jgi:RecD/TraA family predicted helicase
MVMNNEPLTKEGLITSIVFASDDGNYTVLKIQGAHGSFSAVGAMPEASEGRFVRLTGRSTTHRTYGEQFEFDTYAYYMPSSVDGIKAFLGSGVIKGVGPKMAAHMIDEFGENVIDVIEHDYIKLADIRGISIGKAEQINESYMQHKEFAAVSMFFQQYGISMSLVMSLYKEFGAATVEVVKSDPYRMMEESRQMTFAKADQIARLMGMANDDEKRIKAGILWQLRLYTNNGDTYALKDDLLNAVSQALGVSVDTVDDEMLELMLDGRIMVKEIDEPVHENVTNVADNATKHAASQSTAHTQNMNPVGKSNSNLAANQLSQNAPNLATDQSSSCANNLEQGDFSTKLIDTHTELKDSLDSSNSELIHDNNGITDIDKNTTTSATSQRGSNGSNTTISATSQRGSKSSNTTTSATSQLDSNGSNTTSAASQSCSNSSNAAQHNTRVTGVWIAYIYDAEMESANRLLTLKDSDLEPVRFNLENLIETTSEDLGIELDEVQQEAIKQSVLHGVYVITGGPGTGKSTIVSAILDIYKQADMKIMIAAPTGRAAKRITAITGFPAMTIHRMLGAQPGLEDEHQFSKDEDDPLEYDVIVIDESSMIDILLMQALLRAIQPSTRLILVGDADQLPPVGPGNVLRDIIDSKIIPTMKLVNVYRQAEQSLIIQNAHRINQGQYPISGKGNQDFFILNRHGEYKILDTIVDLCVSRLPKAYPDLDIIKDIQIITPTKKGMVGSVNINAHLREVLNPEDFAKDEMKIMGTVFRVGDKVMHTSNNYELEWVDETDFTEGEGIFNGDVGFIHSIDSDMGIITVVFDGTRFVEYDEEAAGDLEHAYAITIHKSQGSEFPFTIIPMARFAPMLSYRNLIYTGVTRGRDMVVIVGERYYLEKMVDNDFIQLRRSAFKHFLEQGNASL